MQNLTTLKKQILQLSVENGFQQATIADIDTSQYFPKFEQWLADGNHGNMSFLERNQQLRKDPAELHPGACRVISVRYNYLPENARFSQVLEDPNMANISRYALGRDYHKLMRKKLQKLAVSVFELCETFEYRVFVDSAPVLETSFAEKSGLGWKGKHTLIINKDAGSWFFLGEIFINIPLKIDPPVTNECGSCTSCINLCPTGAIIAPYKIDARKCISYLTIENQGEIPIEYRKQMGNRIYGCDDCQLACPWNRFAALTEQKDFSPRNSLDNISLLALFKWTEKEFNDNLAGNPIRRIGYQRWQRNITVALGNSKPSSEVINALEQKLSSATSLVKEHILWALCELKNNNEQTATTSVKTQKLVRSIKKMLPRDA